MLGRLENEYGELAKRIGGLSKDKDDLESELYRCMYIFEDVLSVADAYDSAKGEECERILQEVFGY